MIQLGSGVLFDVLRERYIRKRLDVVRMSVFKVGFEFIEEFAGLPRKFGG